MYVSNISIILFCHFYGKTIIISRQLKVLLIKYKVYLLLIQKLYNYFDHNSNYLKILILNVKMFIGNTRL